MDEPLSKPVRHRLTPRSLPDEDIPRQPAESVDDIRRNGNEGIGKPEPLKHGFQGYWSRRVTDEHRLVYRVAGDEIRIAACRYHYGK